MRNNYDYIIVGAGSAGCAVANRLSENPQNNVLLIEAGRASHPVTRLPASFALLIDNPLANWRYRSEPEESTGEREIPIPRGKLLGGSSAINGLVYVRGNKLDYDTWAQMGNTGWSYDDVLPYFKKAENFQGDGDDEFHGFDGPLNVKKSSRTDDLLMDVFLEAGQEAGFPLTDDFNGKEQEGFWLCRARNLNGESASCLHLIIGECDMKKKTSKLISETIA